MKMPPPPMRRMPPEQMFNQPPPLANMAPFQHDRDMDNRMAQPMPGRTGLSNIPAIMRRRKLRTAKR